jgi:hypothetical protein
VYRAFEELCVVASRAMTDGEFMTEMRAPDMDDCVLVLEATRCTADAGEDMMLRENVMSRGWNLGTVGDYLRDVCDRLATMSWWKRSEIAASGKRVFWAYVVVVDDQVIAGGPVECLPFPVPTITACSTAN